MKAILEFDLGVPGQDEVFVEHLRGPEAFRVLSEVDNYLRNKIKHEALTKKELDAYCETREFLAREAVSRGIGQMY